MYFITFQWRTHHIHQRGRFSPSGVPGFLHQWNWPRQYNWNIIESGVKHHKPNQPKLYTNPIWNPLVLFRHLTNIFLLRSTVIICHLTDDAAWSLDYHEHLELVILSCVCKYVKELVFLCIGYHRTYCELNILWWSLFANFVLWRCDVQYHRPWLPMYIIRVFLYLWCTLSHNIDFF